MHRVFRNRMIQEKGVDPSKVDTIRIQKFTDLICGGLKLWEKPRQHFVNFSNTADGLDTQLARIRGKDGSTS